MLYYNDLYGGFTTNLEFLILLLIILLEIFCVVSYLMIIKYLLYLTILNYDGCVL